MDQIVLAPDDRANWVKKLYDGAVAASKTTLQLITANTNLAACAVAVLPRRLVVEKGAMQLRQREKSVLKNQPVAETGCQTKLVPPPDPMVTVVLVTFSVGQSDLETLAANRAKAVQTYDLQTGKVEAPRLFLKESQAGGLRSDDSRVYFQFR